MKDLGSTIFLYREKDVAMNSHITMNASTGSTLARQLKANITLTFINANRPNFTHLHLTPNSTWRFILQLMLGAYCVACMECGLAKNN